ncbi:MAG: hypothetical protein HYZ68_01780, partial [Chloroflexi bacterium]|nr:hypothetical protein [Chloroflexota bacterium]
GAQLTTQKVRDLSRSPNFSARQIAMTCFMLAHYIADAHMPLHCDLRDMKIGGASRLPDKLHDSIEAEWESYLPSDEQFVLHQRTPKSVSQLVTQLPINSPLAIDTGPRYRLDGRIGWTLTGDEWDEMFAICRVSYAVSRKWIDNPYPSASAMQAAIGAAAFHEVTNAIFHDAIAAVARIWNAAWERFVRV